MRAKVFEKNGRISVVLEAENSDEEKQLERVWASRESITLSSVCRIEAPSPPGIFLSLKVGSGKKTA